MTYKKKIMRYYNQDLEQHHHEESYSHSNYFDDLHRKTKEEIMYEFLDPKQQERIVDVGCSDGHLVRRLAHRYKTVVGVDVSRNAISLAKSYNNPRNVHYVIADASACPINFLP